MSLIRRVPIAIAIARYTRRLRNLLSKKGISSESVTIDHFLEKLILSKQVKTVIQVGANDGIQNDPIRRFLKDPKPFKTILIEPIPYYVNKLRELYVNRSDVSIVHAAAGSSEGVRELFFIPPELADEMNGDGPQNYWAHGQGSFDRNIVIHWIRENRFRVKRYVDRMNHYIESITSAKVNVLPTASLLGRDSSGLLLIIDVQGFELDVLDGINWNNPPEWVIIEDDLGSSFDCIAYFSRRGFNWVGGDHDKIFSRTE